MIKANVNDKDMLALQEQIAIAIRQAKKKAIDKTAKKTRLKWIQTIAAQINLPDSLLQQTVLTNKKNENQQTVLVDSDKQSTIKTSKQEKFLPLKIFSPVQTNGGVRINIKRPQVLKGTFMGKGKLPKKHIFSRKYQAGSQTKRVARLSIQNHRWTSSIESIASDNVAKVSQTAPQNFSKVFVDIFKKLVNN